MALKGLKRIFQKLFCNPSKNSSRSRDLPDDLQAGEQFTRFILSRSLYSPRNGRVKPQALMPALNQESNRYETSTYRVADLSSAEIWQLGYCYVENPDAGRSVKARGTGGFELVSTQGLMLDVKGDPYPIHVDVIGWPESKDERLMKATEIANRLTLEVASRE